MFGAAIAGAPTPLTSADRDRIVDFGGSDSFYLVAETFGLQRGALKNSVFKIKSKGVDANDRIIFDSARGELQFDADGSGAGKAVVLATFDTQVNLTASMFQVVGNLEVFV